MNKTLTKQISVFCVDLFVTGVSFYLSLLLRYDFNIDPVDIANLPKGLLIVIAARGSVFYALGLYRGIEKYAGLHEFMLIVRAVIIGSIFYIFLLWIFVIRFPRVALIYDPVLLILFLGAIHFSHRILQDIVRRKPDDSTRILIFGAGDAGDMIVREISKNKRLPYNVIGFVDDNPNKLKSRINGVSVISNSAMLASVVKKEQIKEIIIAIPAVTENKLREIQNAVSPFGVKVSTVLNPKDLLKKQMPLTQIHDIRIEDLIGRKPIEIPTSSAFSYMYEKSVLITGAAGSIGQELSRQIAKFHPARLIMVDRDESGLFCLEQNMGNHLPKKACQFALLDIGNKAKLERTFSKYHPDIVFHSAAFKHVPILEKHPDEAVENNVRNTLNIARLAEQYGVDKFVNVSTDKAVYPSSIMGATKRITEMILLYYFPASNTKFMTVRFGNVIGSRGSVLNIFHEQIKNGGPVTITDPEMRRYFMTIPEAVTLINQVCAIGKSGEIFILDMGKPVKIVDFACDVLKLYGLNEDTDIEVIYTGKRPGEKLKEELWFSEESPQPTSHKKILRAKEVGNHFGQQDLFKNRITELLNYSSIGDINNVLKMIREIVPEYQPLENSTQ